MTDTTSNRSNILSSIYQTLPEIDDDHAAELVYSLEDKKTLPTLEQDMQDLFVRFGQPHAIADNVIAEVLLDKISLQAAQRQLYIKNNALTILELAGSVALPAQDKYLLLCYYASIGAEHFFDEEFSAVFKNIPNEQNLSDADKVIYTINELLVNARQGVEDLKDRPEHNKKIIYKLADKYHLSFMLTSNLLTIYTLPGAADFGAVFAQVFTSLQAIHNHEKLNASLTARTLLEQLTQQDAQDITLTSKLLNGKILEDDLITIACRYLKLKTPQDIVETFDAILKRLPHVKQKEENLALAVHILLDGTEPAFEKAHQAASLRRERILLRNALEKRELFAGYEGDLSLRFAGQTTAGKLTRQAQDFLHSLPFLENPTENRHLACKVLLGLLSKQEALQQAEQDYQTHLHNYLSQRLQTILKNRNTSKKSTQKYLTFIEGTLAPYHFWKSHLETIPFVLEILANQVEQQEKPYIAKFVLDMLENGSSLELIQDLLTNIHRNHSSANELNDLLSTYKQTREIQ